MVISKENIDYYISESESYRQIAENFVPEVESVPDTTFGIITGCVYSGFLQAYQNQQLTPSLEDMREFNQIMKEQATVIKKSILGISEVQVDEKESENELDQDSAENNS